MQVKTVECTLIYLKEVLWENLNKVLSISPQKTGKINKIPESKYKIVNKNNIFIDLNQPTIAGFYRFLVFEANSFFW